MKPSLSIIKPQYRSGCMTLQSHAKFIAAQNMHSLGLRLDSGLTYLSSWHCLGTVSLSPMELRFKRVMPKNGRTSRRVHTSPDSLYGPLSSESPLVEIRLLEILNTADDSVTCRLQTVPLDSAPPFAALSYVWGDPAVTEEIIVNGKITHVTTNLAEAIRHIANLPIFNENNPSRLWVDALCINQHDVEERNHQVSLMRNIYSLARVVLSWLGNDKRVSLAFETIELLDDLISSCLEEGGDPIDFLWLREEPSLCRDESPGSLGYGINMRWISLIVLFELPYWSRVWILQEVVLAQIIIYVCPSRWIVSEKMKRVSYNMTQLRELVKIESHTRPSFIDRGVWLVMTSRFVKWVKIQTISWHRERRQGPLDNASVLAMSALVRDLHATDPKDYIYGLLGLTGLDIRPDYRETKTLEDVYSEYVMKWIDLSLEGPKEGARITELHFLADAGVGLDCNSFNLPSWAPNYPGAGKTVHDTTSCHYGLADYEVFDQCVVRRRSVVMGPSLFVTGACLLRVDLVTRQPENEEMLMKYICNFVARRSTHITGVPSVQSFFHVVRAVSSSGKSYATLTQVMGFLIYLFTQMGKRTTFEILDASIVLGRNAETSFDDWIFETFFPGVQRPNDYDGTTLLPNLDADNIAESVSQFAGGCWIWFTNLGTYTFIETRDGDLGLAPKATLPGDVVCVLKGSGVLVTLRKVGNFYVHIGTCFVPGLMEGQAKQFLDSGRAKVETFELR